MNDNEIIKLIMIVKLKFLCNTKQQQRSSFEDSSF